MRTAPSSHPFDHTNSDTASKPERLDVVVIGGGQAGLAVGHYLARRGLRFVILDAHARIGDAWRDRWDSLTLFTPAKISHLPGMPFPAPPYSFPSKDEVATYLESYAEAMQLPVRSSVEATRVSRSAAGDWEVSTSDQPLVADAVVIATGGYQAPKMPSWASAMSPKIVQLHSSDYRNPSQLQTGPVLVVGASHSGAEIAIEVARDHSTVLAGRDTGQVPFPTTGRIVPFILPVIWFVMNHVLTENTPLGRRAKTNFRRHGFPLEHPGRSDVVSAGVERVTQRVIGVRDGNPTLADGRVLDVRNVIWCTGFDGEYSWIEEFEYGEDGFPEQDGGVVKGSPGLYFVGLKFQRAATSSLVGGVGRDAQHIVDHIAAAERRSA